MSTPSLSLSSFHKISSAAENLDRQILIGKNDKLVLGGKSVSVPQGDPAVVEQQNISVRAALAVAISNEKGLSASAVNSLIAKLGLGNGRKEGEIGNVFKPLLGRDIRAILSEVENAREIWRLKQQVSFMNKFDGSVRSRLEELNKDYSLCPEKEKVFKKFRTSAENSIRSVGAMIDFDQHAGKVVDLDRYTKNLNAILDTIMAQAEEEIAAADKEQRMEKLTKECSDAKTNTQNTITRLKTVYPKCPEDVFNSLKETINRKIDDQADKVRQSLDGKKLDDFSKDLTQLGTDTAQALSEAETKIAAADKEQRVAEARTQLERNCSNVKAKAQAAIARLKAAYPKCPPDEFETLEKKVNSNIDDNLAKAEQSLKNGKLEDFAKNLEDLIDGVNKVLAGAQKNILARVSDLRMTEMTKTINDGHAKFFGAVTEAAVVFSKGSPDGITANTIILFKKRENDICDFIRKSLFRLGDTEFKNVMRALEGKRNELLGFFKRQAGRLDPSVIEYNDVKTGVEVSALGYKPPVELVKIEPLTVLPLEGEVEPPKDEPVEKKIEPSKNELPKNEPEKKEQVKVAVPQKPVVPEKPVVDVQKELANVRAQAKNVKLGYDVQVDEVLDRPVGGLGKDKWDKFIRPSLEQEYATKSEQLRKSLLESAQTALEAGNLKQVQQLQVGFMQQMLELCNEIRVKARLCQELNDSMAAEFVAAGKKKGDPNTTVVKHVQSGYPTSKAKDDVVTAGSFVVDAGKKTVTLLPDTVKMIFKTMSFQLQGQDLHRLVTFNARPNGKVANGVDIKTKYVTSGLFPNFEPTLSTTMSVSDGKMKIRVLDLPSIAYRAFQSQAVGQVFSGEDKDGHHGDWLDYVQLKQGGLVDMTIHLDTMITRFGLSMYGFDKAIGMTVGNDGSMSIKFG